jgi:hypothetical protein
MLCSESIFKVEFYTSSGIQIGCMEMEEISLTTSTCISNLLQKLNFIQFAHDIFFKKYQKEKMSFQMSLHEKESRENDQNDS